MDGENDRIEDLIRDIAVKHGIAVGRDDPIMILQTINERLMRDTQQAQQQALDGFKSELELISHRWGQDAKDKAERILNAALKASKESMASSMADGSRLASEAVRKELAKAVSPVTAASDKVSRAAWLVLAGSAFTFMATVVVWVMTRR